MGHNKRKGQLSVTLDAGARAELRAYAAERERTERLRTGNPNFSFGPCLAARELLERWMEARLKKREEAKVSPPNASPGVAMNGSKS